MIGNDLAALAAVRYRDVLPDGTPAYRVISSANWLAHLNEAQFRMVSEARMPLEETTSTLNYAAGNPSKALPAGVYAVRTVRDTTDLIELEPVHSRRLFDRLYPDPAQRGTPSHYHLVGANLHLRLTPDKAIAVDVTHHAPIAELAGAAEPVVPLDFHRALVDGALENAFLDDGKVDEAGLYRARFQAAIGRLKLQMAGERLGRKVPVSKRYFSWA